MTKIKKYDNEELEIDVISLIEEIVAEEEATQLRPMELKEEVCRVLWVKHNLFGISFKDYGITLSGSIDKSEQVITVKYDGEIGKPNFKIISFK